ncbi:MAG: hypothetical protein MZV65_30560 [Chromatiales bacterium]|nr:hypothetical protein [Chromatiales bacterium]
MNTLVMFLLRWLKRLTGRAEIDQNGPAVRATVEIGGLQVTMQIAQGMHGLQRRQHITEQTADVILGQDLFPLEYLTERFAILVIHDDVGGTVRFEEVSHPHHAGMTDLCQHPGFIEKPFQTPGVTSLLAGLGSRQRTLRVGKDIDIVAIPIGPFDREVFLDSGPASQRFVYSLVGDTEPARAQHRLDAIMMQAIADGQRVGFLDHGVLSWDQWALSGTSGKGYAIIPNTLKNKRQPHSGQLFRSVDFTCTGCKGTLDSRSRRSIAW